MYGQDRSGRERYGSHTGICIIKTIKLPRLYPPGPLSRSDKLFMELRTPCKQMRVRAQLHALGNPITYSEEGRKGGGTDGWMGGGTEGGGEG